MTSIEKRIIEWVQAHILPLALLLGSFLALAIRYYMRDMVSYDAEAYLLPWYEEISQAANCFSVQVGNYNMPYQNLIRLLSFLPIRPLYAYKLLSIVFDYLLAVGCALLVRQIDGSVKAAVFAYLAVLFSPLVIMNSSVWAQCDSIYTFFCIFTLVLFCRSHYKTGLFVYGFAIAYKLQAVFLLPVLLFVCWRKRRFSFLHFLLCPLPLLILCMPNFLLGHRSPSEIISIYLNQTSFANSIAEFRVISADYPSFLNFIFSDEAYYYGRQFGILFALTVLALYMLYWISHNIDLSPKNLVRVAFLLVYTCVYFLPNMHERYGFLYEILSIFLLLTDRKTLPAFIALQVTSFLTYREFLFYMAYDSTLTQLLNLFAYVWYAAVLLRSIDGEAAENVKEAFV